MDVVLPGYTSTSTSSGSQVSGSSSRLKELSERLRQRSRESSARAELPPTWREQPVRSVMISSYKKNTEKRYHRHNRLDWNAEQKARRDCFHDAAWVEYLAPPRVPEGAVHLIIGDSLVRVLTRIQSHWQTGILSFAGAATPQILATLEMLGMTKVYTVTLMIGTNDVSRGEARKVTRLHDKMSCLLEELRIQMDPILLTVCTVPYNMKFDQHALEAQLRVVDKLLNPGEMELPDAAYEGSKWAEDPRYGKPCGSTQLAKTLAVYDRADSAAARVVIVAGSDFEGTSPKLFWPETLIYSLPGAELNQMLTLVVAIKSEMPCEPELLLFAGMNDHLHAAGLLEQLKGNEPTPRKIWEAIQTLFAAMNEVQENVVSRFGSKTKVVFTTSPGYANMPPALQFVYAVLILIAEGNEWRILMAAPNRELEPSNLRLRKSELAAAWADISHALRGFYGLADILIVLDEVLLLEISNFARQLKFSPVIGDDHPAINQLTASL